MAHLTLQLQGFEFHLPQLGLSLGLPQSDRHQLILQFIHGVFLGRFLPVSAPTARAAAPGHVELQTAHGVSAQTSDV